MKFAIPSVRGKLCSHFGHCEEFVFIEVEDGTKTVSKKEAKEGPAHAPGVIPKWVAEQGANIVLAGGMGGRAIDIFNSYGIKVVTGCPAEEPEKVVLAYLNNTLETRGNSCDHGSDHKCDH